MNLSNFRVKKYAQTDEESVILNLLDVVRAHGDIDRFVVDIGAGKDAYLSNSQFLIEHAWKSCRFDLQSSDERHARAVRVTVENVASLLTEGNVPMKPGVLSIDIDGIDLYVLFQILATGYRPSIIVYEFNGCREPANHDVIVYNPQFSYAGDDYYGASWNAFQYVLNRHGYMSIHQVACLNGFAVAAEVGLEPCAMPQKSTYHRPTQRADAQWVDARTVL